MKMTVKTTGFRELERALAQLPQATRRPVALRALRAGGEPIARVARALAPVDEGDLRESIDVSTNLASSQRGDRGSVAPVEMYIGPGQHPQAITQEFGTFNQPAQPFMRPAWDITMLHALDLTGAVLGNEIHRQAARLAAKAARGG